MSCELILCVECEQYCVKTLREFSGELHERAPHRERVRKIQWPRAKVVPCSKQPDQPCPALPFLLSSSFFLGFCVCILFFLASRWYRAAESSSSLLVEEVIVAIVVRRYSSTSPSPSTSLRPSRPLAFSVRATTFSFFRYFYSHDFLLIFLFSPLVISPLLSFCKSLPAILAHEVFLLVHVSWLQSIRVGGPPIPSGINVNNIGTRVSVCFPNPASARFFFFLLTSSLNELSLFIRLSCPHVAALFPCSVIQQLSALIMCGPPG